MDKRSLLFICLLSASLFLVNTYFSYLDKDKHVLVQEQNRVKKEQQFKDLNEIVNKKTAGLHDFQVAELYSGSEQIPSAKAILVDDVAIAFAWNNQPPEEMVLLTGKEIDKKEQVNENKVYLINTSAKKGDLLLYSKNRNQKLLTSQISPLGSYELQMLTFGAEGSITPVYVELKDGVISIPVETLANIDPNFSAPQGKNLLFLKVEKRYLPVGIYLSQEKSFIPLKDLSAVANYINFFSPAAVNKDQSEEKEQYYLLETPFQQLVFSNRGGALIEINLPFTSASHPHSVVRAIEADRLMVEYDSQNALFPGKSYRVPDDTTLYNGTVGGYYPLLRRDFIAKNPKNTLRISPSYYAFNVVSDYPEVAEQVYKVTHIDKQSITFESRQPHRTITKTYTLPADPLNAPYCMDLTIKIDGDSRGLWLTSGAPEVEWISGAAAPALKFRITRAGKPEVENISLPTDVLTVTTTSPDWVCTSNGFFAIILNPITPIPSGYKALKIPGQVIPSRLLELEQLNESYDPNKMPGYTMLLPLGGGSSTFRLYSGPLSETVLKKVDAAFSDPNTGYNPDYLAAISFHGWFSFISAPFTKILLFLMEIFYKITHSWAISIVLLTVALRLMLYPLNSWSMKAMARTQEIAPLIQKIQTKYKNDKKRMQLEIANLYREKKINPLSGCIPMLIQIPFLISMFDLLKSTFALRGAPFIPGWIDDLAAPDVLFDWGFSIPFIGSEFHLLPFLLGAVMFLQTRLSTSMTSNPNEMSDAQRQQKAMGTMMPILFTFMFYSFPSGLNIYWLSSTLIGIGQQWLTNRSKLKTAL